MQCIGDKESKNPLQTGKSLCLSYVFLIPPMRSMISISQLASNGIDIRFEQDKVTIGIQGSVLISGLLHDKLYLMDNSDNAMKSNSNYFKSVNVCIGGFSLL